MTEIFPILQPRVPGEEVPTETRVETLPMYRDVLWDVEKRRTVWATDGPVMVTGAKALEGWIWRALSTVRRRWPIFTHDYGCEVEGLVGKPYTPEVRQSEGLRMIREALEPSPYITGVRQASVDFHGSQVVIQVVAETVYGEVIVDV